MGGVKDRYLKSVSANDQYVGCCANFADLNSAQFSVSPPHFGFFSFEIADTIARKKELDKFLSGSLYQMTCNDDGAHIKYLAKFYLPLYASITSTWRKICIPKCY